MFRSTASYFLVPILWGAIFALPQLSADDRPAAAQIREYITQAAAMRRSDFNRIARMSSSPKPADFEDKSLTLVLLFSVHIDQLKKSDQFQFQTDQTPRPSRLAQEVNRGLLRGPAFIPTAPVSMIQQDRITDVTCEVDGKSATGTVSYKVPGVYAGEVKYIAEKQPTHWHITELIVSDFDIHLARGEGGLWKENE